MAHTTFKLGIWLGLNITMDHIDFRDENKCVL
jgi:hypothetical protein